jgi:DNA sulfur modification protein DndB
MRLGDVAERIKYATELHHPERYDEWIQREIRPERKKKITEYLLSHPERFFSSLVVTVYGGQPKWLDLGILDTSELSLEDLSPMTLRAIDKSLGLLLLSGREDLFPIDGQHRLSGIREAVKTNPDRKEDIISVLFVADRGRIETRRLFSTLNRYAVPVNKGERIILDEDDGIAIITRRLMEKYPLFLKPRVAPPKQQSLQPEDQTSFITALTIYTMNKMLCTGYLKGDEWKSKALVGPQRPSDEQLDAIQALVTRFWDLMVKNFPAVRSVRNQSFQDVISRHRGKKGNHLLFRPVGQMALARAVRKLHDEEIEMEEAFEAFSRIPSLELSDPPWRGVVWSASHNPNEPGNIIPQGVAERLAARLLMYLGGFVTSREERSKLLADYRKALDDERASLPTT